MLKQPTVYILASKRNGTLYVGVTTNLAERIWQHKNGYVDGFTNRYKVHVLVYYEFHDDVLAAIAREKQVKKWNRAWKIRLIEQNNPDGETFPLRSEGRTKRAWVPACAGTTHPPTCIFNAPHGLSGF